MWVRVWGVGEGGTEGGYVKNRIVESIERIEFYLKPWLRFVGIGLERIAMVFSKIFMFF